MNYTKMPQVTLIAYSNTLHTFTIPDGSLNDQLLLGVCQGEFVQIGVQDPYPEEFTPLAILDYDIEINKGEFQRMDLELTAYVGRFPSRTSALYYVTSNETGYSCGSQYVRYGGPYGEEYLNNEPTPGETESLLNLVSSLKFNQK